MAVVASARRWRLGQIRRELLARQATWRGPLQHRLANRLGLARADGGRRGRAPGGVARHRLSHREPGPRRELGRAVVHRGRFPARLLPALPRLSRVLPALRLGPLPAVITRQFAAGRVRVVTRLTLRPGGTRPNFPRRPCELLALSREKAWSFGALQGANRVVPVCRRLAFLGVLLRKVADICHGGSCRAHCAAMPWRRSPTRRSARMWLSSASSAASTSCCSGPRRSAMC